MFMTIVYLRGRVKEIKGNQDAPRKLYKPFQSIPCGRTGSCPFLLPEGSVGLLNNRGAILTTMTERFNLFQFVFEELDKETKNNDLFGPVYHGGSWDGIKPIRTNGRGALGVGAYFTPNKEKALSYATESGGKVIEAYLKVKNPLKIFSTQGGKHPVVEALVALGADEAKASQMVEKQEEKYGYIGSQIKTLALSKGYDALFQYYNNQLSEIVIWDKGQVSV